MATPNADREPGREVPGVSFTALVELITALEPELRCQTPLDQLFAGELKQASTNLILPRGVAHW